MLRDGICGNKPWQRNVNKIIKFNLVGLTVRIADGLIPQRHTAHMERQGHIPVWWW